MNYEFKHDREDEALAPLSETLTADLRASVRGRLQDLGISPEPKAVCTQCERLKLLTEFYLDKSKANGRSSHCKNCIRAYQREYRAKRPRGPRRRRIKTQEDRDQEERQRAERSRAAAIVEAENRRRLAEARAKLTPEWWRETNARLEAESLERVRRWRERIDFGPKP